MGISFLVMVGGVEVIVVGVLMAVEKLVEASAEVLCGVFYGVIVLSSRVIDLWALIVVISR